VRLALTEQPLHEGPIRERQLLEHEARVVGRDEPAAAVDDVGTPALADLDLCRQRPENLEVQDTDDERVAGRAGQGAASVTDGSEVSVVTTGPQMTSAQSS